jgi:hypothetical protein
MSRSSRSGRRSAIGELTTTSVSCVPPVIPGPGSWLRAGAAGELDTAGAGLWPGSSHERVRCSASASGAIALPSLVSTQKYGTLMPSIASRLGLLSALMLPNMALAETAPLNVPILLRGSIGDDACSEKGRVFEVGSETGGFLPVQSGPGEAPFREIGRLHDGDMVVVCEKLGPWLGVVYGSALLGCQTTILVPVEQTYTGPCDHGWVMTRNVNIDPK